MVQLRERLLGRRTSSSSSRARACPSCSYTPSRRSCSPGTRPRSCTTRRATSSRRPLRCVAAVLGPAFLVLWVSNVCGRSVRRYASTSRTRSSSTTIRPPSRARPLACQIATTTRRASAGLRRPLPLRLTPAMARFAPQTNIRGQTRNSVQTIVSIWKSGTGATRLSSPLRRASELYVAG